jgi:diguanylate cyclase (GGDEF)-like protein/PAS domain S-box-containing protein
MLRLLNCIQTQHDWRLVLLAVAVCLMTSFAALITFQRAAGNGKPSIAWLLTAGIMTGCGIWATHFIAILAFTPGFESFDFGLTALSLGLAVAMVTAGFALAIARNSLGVRLAGGLMVGTAIAVMHYIGVAALNMRVSVIWSFDQVIASILLGQFFGAVAMIAAGAAGRSTLRLMVSAGLLCCAITVHHFVGMSAMILGPEIAGPGVSTTARIGLSIAITLVMAVVIVACTVSAMLERRARKTMSERNRQLDAALNNMSQGLCLFGADGRLQLCNPRFLEIYGLRAEDAPLGATFDDLVRARDRAGTAFLHIDEDAGSPEQQDAANQIVELADGRSVRVISNALSNGGWVATHADITRRLQDEARIAHMSRHDPLTGLANRSAFDQRLELLIRESGRTASAFAMICVDVDKFKQVNSLFGHAVGDALLCAVAQRLVAASDGAFVARLASDEFIVISTAGPQPTTAERICARISAALAEEFEVRDIKLHSNCSIGVSVFPQDGADGETLRTHADVALRRAKTRRNGGVCFFEPAMDEEINAHLELQRDFARAFAEGELELYFQPQATRSGEIVSFEVLLRWIDGKRGFVPPDVFIPVAEELGLIGAVDAWVLRAACLETASWERPLAVAVNLSAASFASGDVAALIETTLRETGLSPTRLEIEITESLLIGDFATVSATLHKIKSLGVRIAMDDFGTGYSSLSYLQSFPFDKLKIDRSFVAAIACDTSSSVIVSAMIGLGHALKLTVLAEGTETDAQRDFLILNGCDELQGYLIGRPKPIGHYRALLTLPTNGSALAAAG